MEMQFVDAFKSLKDSKQIGFCGYCVDFVAGILTERKIRVSLNSNLRIGRILRGRKVAMKEKRAGEKGR